jgi:hypothetical protein
VSVGRWETKKYLLHKKQRIDLSAAFVLIIILVDQPDNVWSWGFIGSELHYLVSVRTLGSSITNVVPLPFSVS